MILSMIVPKEIHFHNLAGVEKLILENPTATKLAIKIRTNHKTALQIHPTHDFVEPHEKKEVIIKLLEVHTGVKLEVNYCIATEEMIKNNDSKMSNVEKKDIKKEITIINVNDITESKVKQGVHLSIENDFVSVAPQKVDTKLGEKKASITLQKTESLVVVEQKVEEDQEENQEKEKKLKEKIAKIEGQIVAKRQSILTKKQQSSGYSVESTSFIPVYAIAALLIAAFLLGSGLRSIVF